MWSAIFWELNQVIWPLYTVQYIFGGGALKEEGAGIEKEEGEKLCNKCLFMNNCIPEIVNHYNNINGKMWAMMLIFYSN